MLELLRLIVMLVADSGIEIGGIIRVHIGNPIPFFCKPLKEEFEVDIVEAVFAKNALDFAWDIGVREAILEYDCLCIVRVL